MSKDLNVTRLCDAYGTLLTAHRRELIRNYYDDDLSLAEIAENFGITRQAALCGIKQAERQLREYEAKLKIVENADKLQSIINSALQYISTDAELAKSELQKVFTEVLY